MKPEGAVTFSVPMDLSEASLEDALNQIGNPKFFYIHIHPRANHYASHIAFKDHHEPKTYKWKFEIIEHPDWNEDEWMVVDQEHEYMLWNPGA